MKKNIVKIVPFILFIFIAIPIYIVFHNKATEAFTIYIDNGIKQFYDIYLENTWYSIFGVFMTAFIVLPIYDLVIAIIYGIRKIPIFILALTLGVILSIFLLYISTFNDPQSVDSQILLWIYFVISLFMQSYLMDIITNQFKKMDS